MGRRARRDVEVGVVGVGAIKDLGPSQRMNIF